MLLLRIGLELLDQPLHTPMGAFETLEAIEGGSRQAETLVMNLPISLLLVLGILVFLGAGIGDAGAQIEWPAPKGFLSQVGNDRADEHRIDRVGGHEDLVAAHHDLQAGFEGSGPAQIGAEAVESL